MRPTTTTTTIITTMTITTTTTGMTIEVMTGTVTRVGEMQMAVIMVGVGGVTIAAVVGKTALVVTVAGVTVAGVAVARVAAAAAEVNGVGLSAVQALIMMMIE